MNFSIQSHLPQDFADSSRVWIYQSTRLFSIDEAFQIENILTDFVANWASHGAKVKGYANLFFGRFIIFMADETATGVSGCSTDSAVHVIKNICSRFNVNLFDRLLLAFIIKEKVEQLPLSQLSYAVEQNFISKDTLFFNNVVLNKKQLENNWIIPVADSWLVAKLKHFQENKPAI